MLNNEATIHFEEKEEESKLRFLRLFTASLRNAVEKANPKTLKKILRLLKNTPKIENLLNPKKSGEMTAQQISDTLDTRGIEERQPQKEILFEPPSTLQRNEDVSMRFKKTEQESFGTSESFWAVDSEAGETYYCKTEEDINKLKAEIFANLIYRECGIPVPAQEIIVYDNKEWIASRKIVDAEACNLGRLEENRKQIQSGFVVDALLANRDVFGLVSNSNILQKKDTFYRLDGGGALDYRGRHGKKHFSAVGCTEIDTMRDKQYATGKVFASISQESISEQVKLISTKLTVEKVSELIHKSGIENPDVYIDSIMSRIAYLQKRFLTSEFTQQMNFLSSENVFPEKTRKEIEELKSKFNLAIAAITNFNNKHEDAFLEISQLKEKEEKEPDLTPDDDWDSFGRNFSPVFIMQSELAEELRNILPPKNELFVSSELSCQELIDLQKKYYVALDVVKKKLDLNSATFRDNAEQALEHHIEADSIAISEQISSHVTGYNDLVSILRNGQLLSKGAQLEKNGHYNAKITSKADKEAHQIVFDRRTFRPEYSSPENMSPVPPVIFMTPSSFLLSEYQGMESDGWHAFGKKHDSRDNIEDNFSLDIGNQNLVIMVPIEYQMKLRSELESMTSENESIDRLETRMNIVYIPKETYRDVKNDRLYTSQDYHQNPKLKEKIYDLAKNRLPKQKLQRGRLVPTGNTGNGSATYDKKLYQYVMADETDS